MRNPGWRLAGGIARTGVGKIDKKALRRQYTQSPG